MESWRIVFRDGLAPLLSLEHLEALREALASDDPRLLQGATTFPLPGEHSADWPATAGCLLGYCGVIEHGGYGVASVAQVEQFVADVAAEAGRVFGEFDVIKWLMNWFDETPRHEMIANLLPEVRREIERRKGAAQGVA